MTLPEKLLYCRICEANLAWDCELPKYLTTPWREWYERFPELYAVPRTLAPHHQSISSVCLHAFGDASKDGVSAAIYAVIEQENGTTQGFVCSKSRIAKKSLTIPRLELVVGHMAVNLVTNIERANASEKVTEVHCWLDYGGPVLYSWSRGV